MRTRRGGNLSIPLEADAAAWAQNFQLGAGH